MPQKKLTIVFAAAFAVIVLAGRFVPHLPNFVSIGALALWMGAYLSKRNAILATLGVMLVSDAFIGLYDWRQMLVNYAALSLAVLIGAFVGKRRGQPISFVAAPLTGAFGGSFLFFAASNFAVWVWSAMYPPTWAGLVQCYGAALPFWRNGLMADLSGSLVFFLSYDAAKAFALWVEARLAAQRF